MLLAGFVVIWCKLSFRCDLHKRKTNVNPKKVVLAAVVSLVAPLSLVARRQSTLAAIELNVSHASVIAARFLASGVEENFPIQLAVFAARVSSH